MSILNTQIKDAINSFDMPRARELLRDAMKDADAETYFLASKVALDDDQKREFLEKALANDPFHAKAHAALKQLSAPVTPLAPVMPVAPSPPQTPTSSNVRELGLNNLQADIANASNALITNFFAQIEYKLIKDTPQSVLFRRQHKQHIGGVVAVEVCTFEVNLRTVGSSITVNARVIRKGIGSRHMDAAKAHDLLKAELEDLVESAASGTATAPRTGRARVEFESSVRERVETEQRIQNSPANLVAILILLALGALFLYWVFSSLSY